MRALAVAAALLAAPAEAAPCRLALVLALDVSSSIDVQEYALQRDGLAAAFLDREVVDALLGSEAHVMAAVIQWSGFPHQQVVVPWTALDSEAAVAGFSDAIAATPRSRSDLPTALAKGLQKSAYLHRENPIACDDRVIDISGDGVNNRGVEPAYFEAQGLFEGITINGLVIKGAVPDPEPYFREKVIRGPGAFLMVANSYRDYPEAIRKKLLREISQRFVSR